MKLLVILLIVCGFFLCVCNAQYLPEVSSYTIYWNKLDAGQSPIITNTFVSDTSVNILWERGDGTQSPYISPYTGTIVNAMVIVNDLTLWSGGDIASISRDIILNNGIYEVTVTESDIYENECGHSEPLFILVSKVVAKIQINIRIQ